VKGAVEMQFREVIEKALQQLINTKHLYQSVTVDFEPCVREQARGQFMRRRQGMGLPSPEEPEETIKQRLLKDLDRFAGISL
jgi:hypothetical protein